MIELTGSSWKSANNAQRIFKDNLASESAQRLVLSLWVISLVETALSLNSEDQWKGVTKDLCEVGYRLPIDQVSDLEYEIKRTHEVLAGRIGSTILADANITNENVSPINLLT